MNLSFPRPQRFLRTALALNALFSLLTGAALFLAPALVAAITGFASPLLLRLLGAGLLLFALWTLSVALRHRLAPGEAALISLSDALWVIGTLALAAASPALFSGTGWVVAGAVALTVDVFCVLQLLGLRNLYASDAPHPERGRSVIAIDRVVTAKPQRVWSLISDIGGYADYVEGLHFSRVVDGEGASAVRECGDAKGRWLEHASHWDEGRSYGFRVQTDADDYPYPFNTLGGEWTAEPHPEGTRIGMRFDVTMKGGLIGDALLAALMVPEFERALDRLLDRWEGALAQPQQHGRPDSNACIDRPVESR